MKKWKLTAVALLLAAGLGTWSMAESGQKGSAKGSGKAISWWIFGNDLDGDVTISGKEITFNWNFSSRRNRRAPSQTFVGTLENGQAVFKSSSTSGIVGRIAGDDSGSTRVDFSGPVSIKNGKLTLELKAARKIKIGDNRVRSISFKGDWKASDSDGTDNGGDNGDDGNNGDDNNTDAKTERVKIGREGIDIKPETKYTVVVPLAGKLSLKVGGGEVTVTRPDGSKVEDASKDIEVDNKQLGTYNIEIKEGSGTIAATFVQDGRIDSRIRPWSSHTWYPINAHSDSAGTNENKATMFHKGGPLEKFDQALKLEGSSSSQHWEINGYGNRTGLEFENGHYSRIKSPKESNWIVDCNLNGVRRYEDDAAYMKMVDTNEDGEITKDELTAHARKNAQLKFWKSYDKDGNGFISGDEISESFVSKYDTDSDKKLNEDEWNKALAADYSDLLDRNSAAEVARTLEERDNDGDGKLSKEEASPSNGMDVLDRGDKDGDGREYYDVNNYVVVMKDGKKHVGNKFEEKDGVVTLFKGYKKDEKVGEYKRDEIIRIVENAADGDYNGSYSVGWWGHCNAWAMAAIMYQVPKEEIEHNGVKFSVRDQKALLVELSMRDTQDSTFWWKSWNNTDDMPDNKYAAGFHRQLQKWLRDEQQGMMADMDLKPIRVTTGFQVWNYPLLGYKAKIREADGDDPLVLEFTVDLQKGSYSDEDSESSQTVTYTLHYTDESSEQIREDDDSKSDWTTKDGFGDSAPKGYVRYLIHPYGFSGGLSSANPYVTVERLEKVFGGKLKRNSLDEIEGAAADSSESGE